MTSLRIAAMSVNLYDHDIIEQKEDYTDEIKDNNKPLAYIMFRALSTAICLGFAGMFVLSLTSSFYIHWSIGLIGFIGSLGLAGAIWLSGKDLEG